MKCVLQILLIFVLIVLLPGIVTAATISSSGDKSQLGIQDELNVSAQLSINVADGTQYFLRGLLYKQGTSNYCGYTWNGSSWFSGPYSSNEGWKNFLPVSIQGSSWSGTLKVKLNPEDAGCKESGSYSFKIQRFTQTGSGTVDDQNELSLSVTIPTQTVTPQPTAKPNTPTIKITSASVAQVTAVPPTTFVKKATSIPIKNTNTRASAQKSVLGGETKKDTPSPTQTEDRDSGSGVVMPPVFLTGGILVIVVACGILLFQEWKKQKRIEL